MLFTLDVGLPCRRKKNGTEYLWIKVLWGCLGWDECVCVCVTMSVFVYITIACMHIYILHVIEYVLYASKLLINTAFMHCNCVSVMYIPVYMCL